MNDIGMERKYIEKKLKAMTQQYFEIWLDFE